LGFIEAAATYLTGTCGIDSLDEIAYLDGIGDVDTTIKGVTNPGGTVTTGKGNKMFTSRNNGISVSIGAVAKLKLCAYFFKHMERVQRQRIANALNLVLVRSYRDQQRHEVGVKKTDEEPEINDKDWPRTLEKIKEYLASQYGVTGATLDYVVHPYIAVTPEAEDPADNYETVDQEMMARAPNTGRSFVDDRRKVWDIMSNICTNSPGPQGQRHRGRYSQIQLAAQGTPPRTRTFAQCRCRAPQSANHSSPWHLRRRQEKPGHRIW
jgi:hypothetical protein